MVPPDPVTVTPATTVVPPPNAAPVVSAGGTLAYAENNAASAIDAGITLSDVDSATLIGATVSITSGFQASEDALIFVNQNGITGSYAAGILTLSGSASVADYQTALRSVSYVNASEAPSGAARTVSYQVDDGAAANNTSNVATATIAVTPVNDAPANNVPAAQTVAEDTDLSIVGLSVSDADAGSATITTTLSVASGTLTVLAAGGAAVAGSGTGAVTLTGSQVAINTTLAAATNVVYRGAADFSGGDTLTMTTNDGGHTGTGGALSDTDTVAIAVTPVNDAPVVSAGGTLAYTENDVASAIDAGITLSDVDSATLTGATASITSGFQASEDALIFVNQNGITGSYAAGILTLSGSASVADYQTALRSVSYVNASEAPSGAARTVSYQVDDGAAANNTSNVATATIAVTPVNDAPTVTAGGTLAYSEGDGAVVIDAAVALTDADDTEIESATVAITGGFQASEDVLAFTDTANITGSFVGGILTLSGAATLAEYAAALQSVTYANTSGSPDTSDRSIAFSVNDGDDDSPVATATVEIAAAAPTSYARTITFDEDAWSSVTYADYTYSVAIPGGDTFGPVAMNSWSDFFFASGSLPAGGTGFALVVESGGIEITPPAGTKLEMTSFFLNGTVTVEKIGSNAGPITITSAGPSGELIDFATNANLSGLNFAGGIVLEPSEGSLGYVDDFTFSLSPTNAPIALADIADDAGTGGYVINGAEAYGYAGGSIGAIGNVNGDGIDDLIVSAPYAAYGSGTTYVVFGKSGPEAIDLADIAAGSGPDSDRGFVITGAGAGDYTGLSVSSGDINGDGIDDLIIGAPYVDSSNGAVYVVFGRGAAGTDPIDLGDIAAGTGPDSGFVITGAAYDNAGKSVSVIGDISGDLIDDLIIGAPYGYGATYIVFGKNDTGAVDLADVAAGTGGGFVITGEGGKSVGSIGDMNGDGIDELIIGAPNAGYGYGAVHVVFGRGTPSTAPIDLADIAAGTGSDSGFVITGTGQLNNLSVSSIGDINGDGIDDILIGAPYASYDYGATYVVLGKGDTGPIDLSDIADGIGGFVIQGAASGDHSGASVASAGDVNGDGIDDILIGAVGAGPSYGSYYGAAYVVFGRGTNDTSAVDLADVAFGAGGFVITGTYSNDRVGYAVSAAGDVNGDGFADLLVGAPQHNGSGAAYVIFGGDFLV